MTQETSQKKVVGRTVAIVLGMICIVLSASLVAVLALYLPTANSVNELNSEIEAKENIIASQNATMVSMNLQIAALQNSLQQSSTKDETIADLNSYISSLLNIVYMNASTILFQNQGVQMATSENITIWSDYLTYAGFIAVQVESSSDTTYVQAIYYSSDVDYNEIMTVGKSGTAAFPVLPTSMIDIRIGNLESSALVNATATAIYHY